MTGGGDEYGGISMRRCWLLLSILLLLAACGGEGGTSPAGKSQVVFETEDGVEIVGTLYATETNSPLLLLLHRLGADRRSWEGFARSLQERGVAALAIDLRGHGESTRQGETTISYHDFEEADFSAMILDVSAALRFLRSDPGITQPDRVGIAGASIGANLALSYAAEDPGIETVVLLSPGFGYRVPLSSDDMVRYGRRPILIMASRQDGNAASDAMTLDALAEDERHTLLLF
ncbi:MAG: alpha/beta fold hydrolase, partial [Deltaproteobacteria bacterium]